jgi:hypothetical protein
LAELAAVSGLTSGYSEVMAGARRRLAGHDPGRVLADLAVMVASGGECISDLAVLRHQPRLSGRVASTATAWRVLERVDADGLAGLRSARAAARERVWAQRELPGLVIDLDATLVQAPLRIRIVGRQWFPAAVRCQSAVLLHACWDREE